MAEPTEVEVKLAKMEEDLNKLAADKSTLAADKERIENALKAVKSNLTDEQRKLANLEEERNTLTEQATTYKTKYETTQARLLDEVVNREIDDAARKLEPISAVQLRTLVKQYVKPEVKEDGTIVILGQVPGMKVPDTVDKVLDFMHKDTASWGNQFKATLKSSGQAPQTDPTKTESPEEFFARRRKEDTAKRN